MTDSTSNERDAKVQELVKECLRNWSNGIVGCELDLVDAHPELAPELGQALRKARMVAFAQDRADSASPPEDSFALRIRCPHCRIHLELLDSAGESMSCHSCGEEFSVADDAPASDEPKLLGSFRLDERIGVGSFGSVWRAFDEELEREVAIKIPRRSQLHGGNQGQFLREARISAQLNHPNIVAVHEVGRDDDTFYIVSDFVQGKTLATHITQRGNYRPKEAAALCETLARAVHHAHQRNVVHRDLKPANVMIRDDGVLQVMDFGLAKRDVAEITMTTDGQVLGTPAYMSPEQASGESRRVDGRADVYSLGVILFELLTGQLPFRGSVRMLIQQVISDDPPSPRKLSANVPRDLETICLKCLAKEPAARYRSAEALADDLNRFADGRPIRARPISLMNRSFRWAKRYPVAAALLGLVTFLAVAGPLFAWHERAQRVRIEDLSNERQGMISQLADKNKELDNTVAEISRELQDFEDRWPSDDAIATSLNASFPIDEKTESIQLLIAKAILLARVDDDAAALATFQRALGQLEQEEGDDIELAKVDCLIRMSEVASKSGNRNALQYAKTALDLMNKGSRTQTALVARVLEQRVRRRLVSAHRELGDRSSVAAMLLEARAGFEFDHSQTNERELYEVAHGLFTRVPPLLSKD